MGERVAARRDNDPDWGARLLRPTNAVVVGTIQQAVVEVTAPVDLVDQRVEFGDGVNWVEAHWEGEPGRRRQATVMLGRDLTPRTCLLRVRVYHEDMLPLLVAGNLVVLA
jgi:hypothetical protein